MPEYIKRSKVAEMLNAVYEYDRLAKYSAKTYLDAAQKTLMFLPGVEEVKISHWTSTKKKLPEDGKEVLFCNGVDIMVGWYNADEKYWELTDANMIAYAENVTHWMPLPRLPGEEDEQ